MAAQFPPREPRQEPRPGPHTLAVSVPDLPDRGLAILRLVADGRTNESIARAVYLSEGAVTKRVTALCAALGVNSRDHAAVAGVRLGLVTAEHLTGLPYSRPDLTDIERQVLAGLMDGGTTAAIARSTDLSPRTVRAARGRVEDKLNACGTAKVLAVAVLLGLAAPAASAEARPGHLPTLVVAQAAGSRS